MLFTIGQNGALDGSNHLVYGLPLAIGKHAERCVAKQIRTAELQRAFEVVLRNIIDMGDHMNSHPVANRAHITRFEGATLLLETAHRLKGIDSAYGQHP